MQFYQGQAHLHDDIAGNTTAICADTVDNEPAVRPLGNRQSNARFRRIDFEADCGIGAEFPPIGDGPFAGGQHHPAAFLHVDVGPAGPDGFFKPGFGFGEAAHGQVCLGLQAFRHTLAAFGAGAVHRRQVGFGADGRIVDQGGDCFFCFRHVGALEAAGIAVDVCDVQGMAVG